MSHSSGAPLPLQSWAIPWAISQASGMLFPLQSSWHSSGCPSPLRSALVPDAISHTSGTHCVAVQARAGGYVAVVRNTVAVAVGSQSLGDLVRVGD